MLKKSRRSVLPWSLLVAVLSLGGCVAATTEVSPPTSVDEAAAEDVALLFVLDADSGSLSTAGDVVKLTMRGHDETMVWFTDRPDRGTGTMLSSSFVTHWGDFGFDEAAPNVALSIHGDGRTQTLVATMTNAAFDEKLGEFTADLSVIPPATQSETGTQLLEAGELPAEFGAVSLFIDDAVVNSTMVVYASTFIPFDSSF